MIFSTLKFSIYFALSFLILCFPVKNGHVFDYLEKVARPLTAKVYFFIDVKAREGLKKGKELFTENAPEIKDKIRSSLSSAKKKSKMASEKVETYTKEETEAIRKILSNMY